MCIRDRYFSGRQKKYPGAGNRVPENSASTDVQAPEYADNYADPYADPYANPPVDPAVNPSVNSVNSGQSSDYQDSTSYTGNPVESDYQQFPAESPTQSHGYSEHPAMQQDHYQAGSLPQDVQQDYGQVVADPLMEVAPMTGDHGHSSMTQPGSYDPGSYDVNQQAQAPANYPDTGSGLQIDPNDMQRPADVGWNSQSAHPSQYPQQHSSNYPDDGMQAGYGGHDQHQAVNDNQPVSGTRSQGGLTGLLSQLSGGLLGRQKKSGRQGSDADALYASGGIDPLVITLHVTAPDGQIIHGPRLQTLFEQRGYHYGQMSIYHSLNQGSIVFSIAKMVEPGTFDTNNPDSYETPGVTMILQLPAPVAADVAFEVFISEARELSAALGCTIVDSDFSSLSQQTVQHLRDSVHQFMHKQRLVETVPS